MTETIEAPPDYITDAFITALTISNVSPAELQGNVNAEFKIPGNPHPREVSIAPGCQYDLSPGTTCFLRPDVCDEEAAENGLMISGLKVSLRNYSLADLWVEMRLDQHERFPPQRYPTFQLKPDENRDLVLPRASVTIINVRREAMTHEHYDTEPDPAAGPTPTPVASLAPPPAAWRDDDPFRGSHTPWEKASVRIFTRTHGAPTALVRNPNQRVVWACIGDTSTSLIEDVGAGTIRLIESPNAIDELTLEIDTDRRSLVVPRVNFLRVGQNFQYMGPRALGGAREKGRSPVVPE